MLLSDLVKYVNAKSFGETHYTYSDILPYFQEAINSLNASMDIHRHIAEAPVITEDLVAYSNAAYTAISDMHISNYIVTYIVVAMDNASLSVTSRTQTYATQLNQYKQQLISDLYRFMPITSSSNIYFDLEGSSNTKHTPNVKAIYNEKIGGVLCGNGDKIPTQGVICDNPYGKIVPKNPEQRVAVGTYSYEYIFIPNAHFRQYYHNVLVPVVLTGYDISYDPVENTVGMVYDLGVKESLEALTEDATKALNNYDMSVIVGSYVSDESTVSTIFTRNKDNVVDIIKAISNSAPEKNSLSVVRNLITNINGYWFGNGDFAFKQIQYDGYTVKQLRNNNTDEVIFSTNIIADYMEAMTGCKDYHKFNYTKPINDYLLSYGDNSLWKLQYDEENGLLAFKLFTFANADSVGLPINISLPEEMDAVLAAANVGKIYRYVGESTENYINGEYYRVKEDGE